MTSQRPVPLYWTLGEIVALWSAAEVGYRIILPLLGFSISYNVDPIANALYYCFWLLVSIATFRDLLLRHLDTRRLWIYAILCLGSCATVILAIYCFSHMPALDGKPLAPYTDLLLANAWYFLPKSIEILVQQTLVAVLIFTLAPYFSSIKKISYAYTLLFGGMHVVIFALSGAPTPYAAVMTLGSIASGALFPYLLLRVKNGFVYTYMIHLGFYFLFALILHAFPPPDYS